MKKNIFCFLIVFFLTGCTTLSSIDKNNAAIDPSDGVNVKEAVAIAQKYCLEKNECKGDVRISTPEVSDLRSSWEVRFGSKNIFALDHAYAVTVEKQSGKVINGKLTR